VTRSVFTLLQVLSEVGGLFGILMAFAATIDRFFTRYEAENFLAGMLYRDEEASDGLKSINCFTRCLFCNFFGRRDKMLRLAR